MLTQDADTQTFFKEDCVDDENGGDNVESQPSDSCGNNKCSSVASLHSTVSAGATARLSNNGDIVHGLDAPVPSLDEKLNRLSWHSSMTSYIAWRLASPHVPSPGSSPAPKRRDSPCEDAVAV